MPPVHAPNNKYPGGGGKGVNTEPGAKGYQVMGTGDKGMPEYSEPKGSVL